MDEDSETALSKEQEELISPGCGFFFGWIVLNTAGMGLGWLAGWGLSFVLPGALAAVAIGALTGLVTGGMQWLLLRSRLKSGLLWILVSTLTWGTGFLAGSMLASALGLTGIWFGVVMGAVWGMIAGLGQWLVMRHISRRAIWWLPSSAFALAAGLMFYSPGLNALGLLYGVLYGFVTSIAVLYMLYME